MFMALRPCRPGDRLPLNVGAVQIAQRMGKETGISIYALDWVA